MEFFLVRHGDAVFESEDASRPLSERGRREVEKVARAAAARHVRVAGILHSGKLRAEETAGILARFLSPPEGVRRSTGLQPEDDPLIARAELEAADAPRMLVGHLPHLARLAALLATGDGDRRIVDFSTATIACLTRSGGAWELAWTIFP